MDSVKRHKAQNYIFYILSVVEVILALRLLFKLLGANPANGFVCFIYALTRFFIVPFIGIFRTVPADGLVFEPATVLAMLIYAIIAYGVVRLFQL